MMTVFQYAATTFLLAAVVLSNLHYSASEDSGYEPYAKCEAQLVTLSCSDGQVVQIEPGSVSYGPLIAGNMCLDTEDITSTDPKCYVTQQDSYNVLSNRCDGVYTCSFTVTDSMFGLGVENTCDVQDTMSSQLIFRHRCTEPAVTTQASREDTPRTATMTLPSLQPTLALSCLEGSTKTESCSNWRCVDGLWEETLVAGRTLPPECATILDATTGGEGITTPTTTGVVSVTGAQEASPGQEAGLDSTEDAMTTTTAPLTEPKATTLGYCPAGNTTDRYIISWPDTSVGIVKFMECPGDTSIPPAGLSRKCGENGVWQNIDFSNCPTPSLEDLSHKEIDTEEDLEELSSLLAHTAKDTPLVSQDIDKASNIIENVSATIDLFPGIGRERLISITQNVLEFGDHILNNPSNISKEDRSTKSISIVSAVESVARKTASSVNSSVTIQTSSIEIAVRVVKLSNDSKTEDLSVEGKGASIDFPLTNFFSQSGKSGVGKLVAVFYNSSKTIWSDQDNLTIGTAVFSASIIQDSDSNGTARVPLSNPFTYTLLQQVDGSATSQRCVFWDSSPDVRKWSTEGCKLVKANNSHTVCQCDHLTNFAVLMDMDGRDSLPDEVEFPLHVITYIGCSISILCLLLSWLTFQFLKNLSSDRNTIHKHLVFTLMLAEILFLVAIYPQIPNFKLFCSVLAGVLHYLFLSVFAWTCLEGVQLYIMLIEVFEAERSRKVYYYLAGYGIPAVIVGVSAAVDSSSYGTDKVCWLNAETGFIWSFIGPVAAVMLVNTIMLGVAIYMMHNHARMTANMKHQESNKGNSIRAWFKGALVLVILLGLTWVCGFIYIRDEKLFVARQIMAYIFTILNSLQGLFIFIFHCFLNDKVQKEYKKLVRRTQWLPDCFRVKYGEHRGLSSVPSHSSSSGRSSKRRKSADIIGGSLRAKKQISGLTSLNSNEEGCVNKEATSPLTSSISSSNQHVCNDQDIELALDEKLVPTFC